MNWKIACLIAFATWSIYGFFGERAGKIHGEKINLIFETLAFILLAVVAASDAVGDFHKVTGRSAFNASMMGLLSAVGFWFMLYALKVVPQEQTGVALLISGMFPVGAMLVSHFVSAPLVGWQWAGIALVAAGMPLACGIIK
ncbi:EamA family transporter [Patescibacteria group bacterium]|nr:EamA family transporter [Patescibacteria group bacterium]